MSRTNPRIRDSRVQALTTPAERMNEVFPISLWESVDRSRSRVKAWPGNRIKRTVLFRRGLIESLIDMGEEILREFGRFRRRHLWVRGLDLFLEAAFVMTITAAAMLLVDRLAFELGIAASHLAQR